MKRITLVCGNGYSSSMLVIEMNKAADMLGVDVEIRAIAESRFQEFQYKTDVVLIGPQLGYILEDMNEKYKDSNLKISVINGVDYGMMNGMKVLKDALSM